METALSHHYTREKFWQAIHMLATGSGSIQERLAFAADPLTRLHEPDDLPEEYRQEFDAVCRELRKDGGDIVETTRKLTDEECRRVAERIVSLYTGLRGGI
jgi:predicted amidohydrolase YtcJ